MNNKIQKFFHFENRWWKDRYDGWRVEKLDTVFRVIPYFLRTRIDAQNLFEERIQISHLEQFIKDNKEQIPNLSIMHIIITALVRIVSQRPSLNRFVVWNKIFARKHLNFAIAIKRSLTDEGEETLIKPEFALEDTLQNVVNKVRIELENNQQVGQKNGSDQVSKVLGKLPDFMFRFVVWSLLWLDKIGLLPKLIYRVSPWHCSIFLTNIGSIGVESIYHHLYEFGTCSMFVAMGKKSREYQLNKDGEVEEDKSITLKFVLDERVCDGFYYASSMRQLNKILANPSVLLTPPESIVIDAGVGRKPLI
ncbi:MAG: 2-oxo acid dehydrogenase subunit E2 [Prevotellaceae bacterium]|jgi:hypothetical protein|nr:2-oxo acid dehydrogenase subunit E2 [Prevotellaceae bacterium]